MGISFGYIMDVLQSTLLTLLGFVGAVAVWIGLLRVTLKRDVYPKQAVMIYATLGIAWGVLLSGSWFTWLYLQGINKEKVVAWLCAFW